MTAVNRREFPPEVCLQISRQPSVLAIASVLGFFVSWPALFLPRCVCWAPSHTGLPTVLPPETEWRQEGKRESHAHIFLKQCCRWRPWGLLCLFHDRHKQRTTDTCTQYKWTQTQQPHTDQHKTRDTKTNLGCECSCKREREHWCDKYSGSPLLLIIFFSVTFFLRVWTKNISNVRFFPHTIIYPMPIEYVLQPYVVVLQFGKGCHVLLLYITCFMAAVSFTKQDGGTIDFQTAAHSSLQ